MLNRIRVLGQRIRGLFSPRRLDEEFQQELDTHLEMLIEENLRRGLSPEEARRAARVQIGGTTQLREIHREMWSLPWVETLLQDLRYGLRQLRRNPGFTAVAVATLALGIGANTAIFSVVNAILLRPLPYSNGSRLVAVAARNAKGNQNWVSPADFADFQRGNHVFGQMTACTWGAGGTIMGGAQTGSAMGFYVAPNFFETLGVSAALGRTFAPSGETDARVVVLNHGLWEQQFGGDPQIIGKKIEINGEPFTVIGVMPKNFWFFYRQVQLWVPLHLSPAQAASRKDHVLLAFARLKPKVTLPAAQADLSAIAGALSEEYPRTDAGWGVKLTPLRESFLVGATRPALLVLLAAVGLVMLVACANVANLFIARGSARRQEIGIRAAIGADRGRIIRQLVTEGLLLTGIGGAVGIVLAVYGGKLILALLPARFSWWLPMLAPGESLVDFRVLAFATTVLIITAVLAALLPAAWSSLVDPQEVLQGGTRDPVPRGRRIRNLLVVSEITLTAALLAGSALLVKSLVVIGQTDPGFRPDHVLTFKTGLPRFEHPSAAQQSEFFSETMRRIAEVPGVVSVALGNGLDLPPSAPGTPIAIQGSIVSKPAELPHALVRQASSQYFRTMQIPLLSGRAFAESDTPAAPRVAIVSENWARRVWPDENAVGKRIRIESGHQSPWLTVVGVVGNTRYQGLTSKPTPSVYLPYLQEPSRSAIVIVRTRQAPMALADTLRRTTQSVDKSASVIDIRTMNQILAETFWQTRFATFLLGLFAGLALVLSMVGIYGVIAYSIGQRTHEIGIRMALGAERRDVLRMVIGQGLKLALIGVIIGIAGALALTRFLSSLLYGVKPTDPLTFIAVSLVLMAVALLACYVPARRAAKVDPIVALRYE